MPCFVGVLDPEPLTPVLLLLGLSMRPAIKEAVLMFIFLGRGR